MNIQAVCSEYDIEGVIGAINNDLVNNLIKIVPEAPAKGGKPQLLGQYGNSRADSNLKQMLNNLVHNAFKEGCKAGKGGLSPS